jgi:hypothetical protein
VARSVSTMMTLVFMEDGINISILNDVLAPWYWFCTT